MGAGVSKLEELDAQRTQGEWEAVLEGDPRGQPVPYYTGVIAISSHTPRATVVAKGGYTRSEEWPVNAQLMAMVPKLTGMILRVAQAPCDCPEDFMHVEMDGEPLYRRACVVGNVARMGWPCRFRRELGGASA